MQRLSNKIVARFFAKVNKEGPMHRALGTPCHLWLASKNNGGGYGQFRLGENVELAHRVAWFIRYGKWPEPTSRHKCDNPACVNVDHLTEGTKMDNSTDMVERNRSAHSERNANAKLTRVAVWSIRQQYATGKFTQEQLAKKFGVSRSTVSLVTTKKQWRRVQ